LLSIGANVFIKTLGGGTASIRIAKELLAAGYVAATRIVSGQM
jgi:hypothetical protein